MGKIWSKTLKVQFNPSPALSKGERAVRLNETFELPFQRGFPQQIIMSIRQPTGNADAHD